MPCHGNAANNMIAMQLVDSANRATAAQPIIATALRLQAMPAWPASSAINVAYALTCSANRPGSVASLFKRS